MFGFGFLNCSTGLPSSARFMNAFQIGAATTTPSAPFFIEELSLLPRHTPATNDGVYPIVQASRKSFVVPVLAAIGRLPRMSGLRLPNTKARALLSDIILTTFRTGSVSITRFSDCLNCSRTFPFLSSIRRMVAVGFRTPSFARTEKALTCSRRRTPPPPIAKAKPTLLRSIVV